MAAPCHWPVVRAGGPRAHVCEGVARLACWGRWRKLVPGGLFRLVGSTAWLFFFQAEDGIRDSSVTGVQTCALPIYYGPGAYPIVMSVAFANPDDLNLRPYIVYSLILHGLLTVAVIISIVFHLQGNNSGSVGSGSQGEVKVSLVSGKAAIPIPPPPHVTPHNPIHHTHT